MSRSAIYTANTGSQSVVVGGIISPGSIIRRYGSNVTLSGNGITLSGTGYYSADVSVTVNATVAGSIGIQLYKDGSAIPGASAIGTAAEAGNAVNLSIVALLKNVCCESLSSLTVVLTNGAGTVTNIGMVVTKE